VYSPIAIGRDVYGLSPGGSGRGYLVALDPHDGTQLWSTPFSRTLSDGDEIPATAAGPGLLLVSSGTSVSAYESVFKPAPNGIDIGADRFDAPAGGRVAIGGVLGSSLRGRQPPVVIQAGRWRRGRFGRVGQVQPERDGYFSAAGQLRRNTRYRATAAGATSRSITIYAYPRFGFGRARPAGRKIRVTMRVRAPGVRFGGRRLFLYYDRRGDNRGLRRLAGGRLRGRSRARAILRFRPLRRAGRRDVVLACVRGQLKMRLGRPSPLTRRCGARRLRVG
jgi:hypothetical protein